MPSTRLPQPRRHVLSQFGYARVKSLTQQQRHEALKRAIAKYGFRSIIGHLNLVSIFQRNSNPYVYRIIKADQKWVSQLYARMKVLYQ